MKHLPQLIVLFLIVLSLGVSMARHGRKKIGRHSLWWELLDFIMLVGLLYWGGFFHGVFS